MQQIDTYDKDLARRRRIEAEYKKRVKGQLFDPGSNKDCLTGLPIFVPVESVEFIESAL